MLVSTRFNVSAFFGQMFTHLFHMKKICLHYLSGKEWKYSESSAVFKEAEVAKDEFLR